MLVIEGHVPGWLAMQFKQTRRYRSCTDQQLVEQAAARTTPLLGYTLRRVTA